MCATASLTRVSSVCSAWLFGFHADGIDSIERPGLSVAATSHYRRRCCRCRLGLPQGGGELAALTVSGGHNNLVACRSPAETAGMPMHMLHEHGQALSPNLVVRITCCF